MGFISIPVGKHLLSKLVQTLSSAGLEKGGLTVNKFGAEGDFLFGREGAEFRSNRVG